MILKGQPLADDVIGRLRRVDVPSKKLIIISIGEDRASSIYVSKKTDLARSLGVSLEVLKLDRGIGAEEIEKTISDLNKDDSVGGIMIQMPIPAGLNRSKICSLIDPGKDIDGFSYIVNGDGKTVPPTVMAIDAILDFYGVSRADRRVLIVGGGFLVGVPLFNLYGTAGLTVEILEKGDERYEEKLRNSDIVILATGGGRTFRKEDFRPGAVVIDASTVATDSKLKGDLDFSGIDGEIDFSPVPGGVGPVTVSMLFVNFYLLCGVMVSGFDLIK